MEILGVLWCQHFLQMAFINTMSNRYKRICIAYILFILNHSIEYNLGYIEGYNPCSANQKIV